MSGSSLSWSERANWGLLIGGIAMEVAAAAFLVIAWAAPVIRVSFIVTGVIMALGGLLLLVLGWGNDEEKDDDERIRNAGITGNATIEAVQPTGVVVHKQPQLAIQLRLHLPGKPPYLITHKEVVPQEVAGTLTPGRSLRTKSDPNDPLKVVIDWEAERDSDPGAAPSPISETGSQTPFS
ncbi:MAG: hypothetical protein ACJ758_01125 [Actinomycetota bacterium]